MAENWFLQVRGLLARLAPIEEVEELNRSDPQAQGVEPHPRLEFPTGSCSAQGGAERRALQGQAPARLLARGRFATFWPRARRRHPGHSPFRPSKVLHSCLRDTVNQARGPLRAELPAALSLDFNGITIAFLRRRGERFCGEILIQFHWGNRALPEMPSSSLRNRDQFHGGSLIADPLMLEDCPTLGENDRRVSENLPRVWTVGPNEAGSVDWGRIGALGGSG